jgi:hypothetical protein
MWQKPSGRHKRATKRFADTLKDHLCVLQAEFQDDVPVFANTGVTLLELFQFKIEPISMLDQPSQPGASQDVACVRF